MAKEYIELDAALNVISDVMSDVKVLHKHRAINRNLKQITTADVEEVKHAYWHDIYLITPWVATGICSACNTKSYINPDFPYFKRCPECGAFMDDWEKKVEKEGKP